MEVDETYIGGNRPGKCARGAEEKSIAFGMVERGGVLQTHIVLDTKGKTLEPFMLKNVEAGIQISNDEWGRLQSASRQRL